MVTRMTTTKVNPGPFGLREGEGKEGECTPLYKQQWGTVEWRTGMRTGGGMAGISVRIQGMMMIVVMVVALLLETASASCSKGVTELWAYTNPGFEEFQDSYKAYLTSSRGAKCRWVVIAANEEWKVDLSFDPFVLMNTKGDKKGDCLDIYDGDSTDAPLLDSICDRKPKSYVSKGRKLFVVYKRGKVNGQRKIGFEYKATSDDNTAQLIKIGAIVGGSLAALGLLYVVIRYTNCFDCLRKKEAGEEGTTRHSNNHRNHERDRLTVQVVEDTEIENGRTVVTAAVPASAANGSSVVNSNVDASSSNAQGSGGDLNSVDAGLAAAMGGGAVGGEDDSLGSDSDTDSLPNVNEMPPSYESLYLTEDGIEPPEYTPPKHQIKNPPRRVHTFN